MEEVSCSDQFSEGQLLGLELAIEIRAIVLRVSDRRDAGRRCQASRCMFASHHSHRFASAEALRPVRKNRVRVVKRMLLVIENGSTLAQLLVQSTIFGRAQSKII